MRTIAEFQLLDTGYIQAFIGKQEEIKSQYRDLLTRYDTITKQLMENWKGNGADAFREDAQKVTKNIAGIGDILTTMCDALNDCLDIISECDASLGKANRETMEENT